MNPSRLIPTMAVTAACALAAVPAASAATSDPSESTEATSANWSGYVAGGGSGSGSSSSSFHSVTGSWTQPAADCTAGGRTYSAFWVGLGGSGQSSKLEQAGTQADCTADGTATYSAWYELVPSAPVTVDLAVHAGDKMTATTTVDGDQVTNSVVNHTTGKSFSKTVTMADPDVSSAEWIAEAPSACNGTTASASSCTPLPLTDFGSASFTGASATDSSGHTGPISDSRWSATAVTLDPSASQTGYAAYGTPTTASSSGGAQPGALSSDGSSFQVDYASTSAGAGGQTTSTGAGSSGGYGYGYGGGDPYGGYGGYSDPSQAYGYGGGYGAGGYGYGYGSGYGDPGVIVSGY